MTKEETRKMLEGTKVYVNGKSEAIQKKLFELGFCWNSDDGKNKVQNVEYPFIYIHENDKLGAVASMTQFSSHRYREVLDVALLTLEIEEEKPVIEFKPFEKVLAREEGADWNADYFSHETLDNVLRFACVGSIWSQVIPYNEETAHLIGTNEPAPKKYVTW